MSPLTHSKESQPQSLEGTRRFAARRTLDVQLRDGTRVRLRPVLPEDKQKIKDSFERLSPESRYRRFMSPMEELSPRLLSYLTEIDYVNHYAVAALAVEEPGMPGLGIARYIRDTKDPTVAEAAVVVADEYQQRGLGTLLLDTLGAVALQNGITRFRAHFLYDNRVARSILKTLGARFLMDQGMPVAEVDLPSREKELRGTPIYGVLKAVAQGKVEGVRPITLPNSQT